MVNNASNETIKNDDKMQFAEKYFSDLKLSANGADAFNRPANVWKVKAEEVGTYAKVADATYTESVKISDIYKDLGLGKTIVKADVSVYEDGSLPALPWPSPRAMTPSWVATAFSLRFTTIRTRRL